MILSIIALFNSLFAFLLGPGMGEEVLIFHRLLRDMGINLRRVETFVTEEFLNDAEIGAALEEMSGE